MMHTMITVAYRIFPPVLAESFVRVATSSKMFNFKTPPSKCSLSVEKPAYYYSA